MDLTYYMNYFKDLWFQKEEESSYIYISTEKSAQDQTNIKTHYSITFSINLDIYLFDMLVSITRNFVLCLDTKIEAFLINECQW